MTRRLNLIALLVALLCAAGAVLLANQRSVLLRGTLDGFPSLELPYRLPPIGREGDLINLPIDEMRSTLIAYSEEGVVWIRQPIPAEWDGVRDLLTIMDVYDMQLVAVLPPDAAAEFAEQFGSQVDYYQLTEPSQTAYEAVHAADPTAEVIGPAVRSTAELEAFGASYDALAVSLADMTLAPSERRQQNGTYGLADVTAIRSHIEENGHTSKRIWLVDVSWQNAVDEATNQDAFERILNEWPWAGPIIAAPQTTIPADIPLNTAAWPGLYPIDTPFAAYTGDWVFTDEGGEFPEGGESVVSIPFAGDSVGAIIARGDYRGYIYVTVDGQPAQGLPSEYVADDESAQDGTYAILTSPDTLPVTEIIPLAEGYPPSQTHEATLIGIRAWGHYPLQGYAVGHHVNTTLHDVGQVTLALLGVVSLGFAMWRTSFVVANIKCAGRIITTRIDHMVEGLQPHNNLRALIEENIPTWALPAALVGTAVGISLSPGVLVTLPLLLVAGILLLLRPTLGPAILLLTAPFYLYGRPLLGWSFSSLELFSLLLLGVWGFHTIWGFTQQGWPSLEQMWARTHNLDRAIMLFIGIALLSLVWAPLPSYAVTELRTMVLEPIVMYLLLRTLPFTAAERWHIVDAWMIAACIVGLAGLGQFAYDAFTRDGFICLSSTLISCNNAALFMGRAIPIGAAVVLLSDDPTRRKAYGSMLGLLLFATLLTTSRGGLLFGVPAGLAVVAILWGGRKIAALVGAGVAAVFVAIIPLGMLIPRFNLLSQSNRIRLRLWQSTLTMLRDRPITGWGLDQFLYAYRGRYIQPAAWQQPYLNQPHNVWLNYWVRLGIVGVLAALWMQIAFWRMAWRTQRRLKWFAPRPSRALMVGLMGSMAAFLAHGMVDATYFVIELAYLFFATLGLTHQLYREAFDD